jgi:predicted HicB family RNase H-like nuclease
MPPTKQHTWNTEMSKIQVRIPSELIDWLREYAQREGVSVNVAAARVIDEYRIIDKLNQDIRHIQNGDPS